MTSPGPPRKRVKVSLTASDENEEQATRFKFNFEELFHVLYGKKESSTVDLLQLQKERKKEKTKTYCVVCRVDRPPTGCPFHEPSSSYTANHDDNSLSYAIKSFPAEVQLCTSTIPGALFGVCAKRVIPEGTWIGPYEGRRVGPEELSAARDNSYVWEIYENGQTSYYIDGSDESTSSWMRFIRCARHKEEQNLYAFQYLGNIFYRSFKEISKGTEMLVWYDEKYPQYLGIPTGLQEIEFVSSVDIAKSPNGDQTSNPVKGETVARTLEDTSIVKENDTKRHVYPESHPQKMTGSSPHRVRHSSYPALTRISGVPHSLGSSSSFPIPNVPSLSSQGTVRPHYGLPAVPIAPPLSSATPAGVYGVGYRPHVPVNISAGIPVGISGRGQLGITGMQTTRVHEEVLDEGPGTISGNSQRSIPSSSLIDNNNPLEKDGSLQIIKRISFSSTAVASEASNEKDRSYHVENLQSHSPIYTSIRHPTESTADPDSGQCPSLNKIRPSLSNQLNAIEEEGRVAIEKGWNNRSHMTKARSPVDQRSDGIRKSRSHPSLASNEDHVSSRLHSKSPRMASSWPSEESQSQDEAGGESSGSNSSTKNEGTGIDEISMWRCRQCQKTFTQRVMLQVHVCPQQPLKPYRCGQCELSFATSTELRSHVETHASEKPFKCGFCSRSFAGATTLNNHIRTHMGKRPFNCEHCGKSFAQAGQLARHQRTPGECETQTSKS